MNLVVQRPDIHVLPVRTPAYRGDWTSYVPHRNALFVPFAFPHSDRPVVRARRDEFDPCTTRHRPVKGVNDSTVRTDFFNALAGSDIREGQEMICGDGVKGRRIEGPVKVEDGCLMKAGQKGVVGVWRICPP